MKHKKLLLVGSLIISTVLIISVVIFSKSTESRTAKLKDPVKIMSASEFRDTLKQAFIEHGMEPPEKNLLTSEETYNELKDKLKRSYIKHEIEFLEKIRLTSVENYTISESVINKINQRIQFLKNSLDLEWNEGFFHFDRIAFLVDLENDFRAVPASDTCKMINEKIAGLRSTLILYLTISHIGIDKIEAFDKVKASASKDMQWFYIPVEAIEPKVSFFSEGGSAISYNFKGNFPFTSHIEELSKYYHDLGLIPLKYDLCQPGKPAGLSGGWYEDHLWTQFWVDKKREKVIQANLIYVGEPFFGSNEVLIVIVNSSSNNLKDALSYYDALHGPESNKTRIDGKFFSFRPINVKISD
ncbi:MAG: hypothetical protein ACYS1A_05165 [Planctomycetota bacterium]